jgi:signal transduction histidine kinase/HAMP domain-containing protein
MLLGIRWGSLYTKIIAWAFVPTMIVLLTVALVTFYAYESATETLVLARDQELVRLAAGQLAVEMDEYTRYLNLVARTMLDSARQQPTLQQARNRLIIFDGGVVALDNFGQVVATEPERPDLMGQDWSNRNHFRQIARTGGPIFSDIISDGPEGTNVVAVAVPIIGNKGEFLGTLVGMFKLGASNVSAFYGSIVKLRIGDAGLVYLVDGQGRVIYHSDVNIIGHDFAAQPVVHEAMAGKAGSVRTRNTTGSDIVAGYAPVPGTPWSLITEENWAVLTGPGQTYRMWLLGLLILGVIIPALVVSLGVRRITQPIEALTIAAQQVTRGNFGQTIHAPTGDEIENLAEQFNLMSAHLRDSYATLEQRVADRTSELAALTKQFAILNAIQASINESLDLSETLDRALDETMGLLNLEIGEIRLLDEDTNELVIRTQRGLSPEFARQWARLPLTRFFPDSESLSGEPIFIEDVSVRPHHLLAQHAEICALATFTLRAKDRLLGALSLATRQGPRAFTHSERELLRAVSDQAAVAIENARLYAETTRRVDEIETLFAVQQAITSRLDPPTVLKLIADEARRLTAAEIAMVFTAQNDELRLSVISSDADFLISPGYRVPLAQSLIGQAIRQRRPLRVADVRAEPNAYPDLVQRLNARTLMVVPLMSGQEVIGSISVINKNIGPFSLDDERVLSMLASSAVIGLENARLYQQEHDRRHEAEQRRRVAESLSDILTVLNSNRPLQETVDYIVSQASRLLGAEAVAVYRLQDTSHTLKIQAAHGLPPEYVDGIEIPVGQAIVGRAVLQRQPVAVTNAAQAANLDISLIQQDTARYQMLLQMAGHFKGILAVPLMVKDEVYGGIVLYYTQARDFTQEDIELTVAFADQVALALENARLFNQAEQAAILEERQRLARELHDSVTQALYGVTMFAEATARLLAAGNVALATDHLNELRYTGQEALQEMRLLLFELRPPVLEEEGLIAALQTRLEAVERRSGLITELKVEGQEEISLPPKIEEGFYRIAQEALNNILKHAQAHQVTILLRQFDHRIQMEISDDGQGFSPHLTNERGGLGLRGMTERAAQLGANLNIASQPGQGTTISVEVQL